MHGGGGGGGMMHGGGGGGGKGGGKGAGSREGDWRCGQCNNINFAFRTQCNRCQSPRGADSEVVAEGVPPGGGRGGGGGGGGGRGGHTLPGQGPGDWRCPQCNNINFSFRRNCNRCQEPRPENAGMGNNQQQLAEQALQFVASFMSEPDPWGAAVTFLGQLRLQSMMNAQMGGMGGGMGGPMGGMGMGGMGDMGGCMGGMGGMGGCMGGTLASLRSGPTNPDPSHPHFPSPRR